MIRFSHVTKRYGALTALNDVNLHIHPGEFVLLSGPSGAGKTTLMRALFAAVRPDSGSILLNGEEITRLPRRAVPRLRRSVGVVFQDFRLLNNLTALQNVAVALEIRGLPATEVQQRSRHALQTVGLEARMATQVSCLSGGEQQRVAFARAIVGGPHVLLADEPTGNLDPQRAHDVLDLLLHEAQRGTTVVVATHDPLVVQHAAASRVILMDEGHVVGTMAGAGAQVSLQRPVEPTDPALLGALQTLEASA